MTTTLISSWRSQNGRWGVELVGDLEAWTANRVWAAQFGGEAIVQGAVLPLGNVKRTEVLRYVSPQEDPQAGQLFVVIGGNLEAVAGCKLVTNTHLQGGDFISVLVAREGAVWAEHGRLPVDVCYLSLVDGCLVDTPVGVLVAAGVVEAEGGSDEVPEVPALSDEVARAWESV